VCYFPAVFPDSCPSRHGARYHDLHHSTKRALHGRLQIGRATLSCQKGKDWLQKIIGTVPVSFTYIFGMTQRPHQLFPRYRSGQINGEETLEGRQPPITLTGSSHKFSGNDCLPYNLMSQIRVPPGILRHHEECSIRPAQVCEQLCCM